MNFLIILTTIFFFIKGSSCGGFTALEPNFVPTDLIIHAQAADRLSSFQGRVLEILKNLSNQFKDMANKSDEVHQPALRALKRSDQLKRDAIQKIGMAMQDFLEDLADAIGVDFNVIKDAVNGSPILSRDVAKIIDFARAAQMTVASSRSVIEGKSDEFAMHLINSNQAQLVRFNLGEC